MKTLIPFLAILLLVSCNLKTTNSVSSTESTEIETENIDSNDPKSVALVSEPEKLLSKGNNEYEFYLSKEDKIHIVYSSEKNISSFIIKNLESGNDFFTVKKPHNNLDSTLTIRFSAVYRITLQTTEKQYIDLQITNETSNKSKSSKVIRDTIICEKGEEGAMAFKGISFVNIYKQPQKNTLSSYWKQLAGGKCRAVIPVVLPKGTTSWAYQLRISTSKQDLNTDGKLCKDMTEANRKIKIFGIPTYESNRKGTSLVREMLNSFTGPEREEDAFCSFYVFKSKKEAEKFTNLAEKWDCYREYSIEGTQSTQSEVPTNGQTTFYIGIQNTRATTAIYTWLDIVAAVPETRYYKVVYK